MLHNETKIQGNHHADPHSHNGAPLPTPHFVDEEGIDLRKVVGGVVRHRTVIIGLSLALGIGALLISLLLPKAYSTEAGVTLLSIRSEVVFDPAFTTTPLELATNQLDKRGQALKALAENPSLLSEVYDQVSPTLTDNSASSLDSAAVADVEGDFLRLQVTWGNPEDATKIANAWAAYYVDTANRAYVSTSSNTPEEARAAAQSAFEAYQSLQMDYENFVATNKFDQVQSEIEELGALITKLRELKTYALVLLNTNSIESNSILITATSSALRGEIQESVHREIAAQRRELQSWYQRHNALRSLRTTLQDIKVELEAGNQLDAAASGDFLAVMMARAGLLQSQGAPAAEDAGASAGAGGTQLQLQVDIEQLIGSGESLTGAEVDSLLETVNENIKKADEEIARLSEELFLGSALDTPTAVPENHTLFTLVAEQVDGILNTSTILTSGSPELDEKPLQQNLVQLSERRQTLISEKETIEAKLRELTRHRDTAWDLYTTLDNKAREAEAQFATGAPQVRLAIPATSPRAANASSPLFFALVGTLLGLALGLLYTLIRELGPTLSLTTPTTLVGRDPHPTGD
ncbi:MAG: hypothetical protein H0T73_12160 [Ardenticatenales bacterium]|nr:hypothetical protein [Ardenticatenales bacterium]